MTSTAGAPVSPWWTDRAGLAVAATASIPFLAQPALGPRPCPFHEWSGLDCPACGGTRATRALLHGRLGAAADHNTLLVVGVLVLLGLLIGIAVSETVRHRVSSARVVRHPFRPGLAVLLLWTALRNVPMIPLLDAGVG
jgi:hypothetical protein